MVPMKRGMLRPDGGTVPRRRMSMTNDKLPARFVTYGAADRGAVSSLTFAGAIARVPLRGVTVFPMPGRTALL
jgi:hypothetical protein